MSNYKVFKIYKEIIVYNIITIFKFYKNRLFKLVLVYNTSKIKIHINENQLYDTIFVCRAHNSTRVEFRRVQFDLACQTRVQCLIRVEFKHMLRIDVEKYSHYFSNTFMIFELRS